MQAGTDILENEILKRWPDVMFTLLKDHTTQRNIIWATDIYVKQYGETYAFDNEIKVEQITGERGDVIRPRAVKPKEEQDFRVKDKAEVFTPAWICNAQNNLIDEAWFGRKDVFNIEGENHTWEPTTDNITFPEGKTWKDYVRDTRLEITCGEAPYLASRYDTTTGEIIPIERRIGLLDRKLRVVSENTETSGDWLDWAQVAFKNTYGYEWQGDNLLLARETLLYTFVDFHQAKFGKEPMEKSIGYIAYIISWNIFQMDGLKFCPPGQEPVEEETQISLFDEPKPSNLCLIRDWVKPTEKQRITFKSLLNQR